MHSAARSAQALALGRRDLDPRRGSLLVRGGKGRPAPPDRHGRLGFEQLETWPAAQIAGLTVQLKRMGADRRYIPLLVTAPGFGWINAFTVASEIGDIERFASPAKLCGYTGLCPRVRQSGATDRRGPLSKHSPQVPALGPVRGRATPASTRSTPSATRQPSAAWAANADPRSPRSTSPADSPRRPGTCSPTTSPSLRQVPLFV
jgi:transposase